MRVSKEKVVMAELKKRSFQVPQVLPELSQERFSARLQSMREKMAENNLDAVVIYGDREHYANYKYFVGFEPRFEESILVIHKKNPSYLILGNECFTMHRYAKLPVQAILNSALSLPDQPMIQAKSFETVFAQAGLNHQMQVGVIGWKYFTQAHGSNYSKMFDLPAFLLDPLKAVVGIENMTNATGILINAESGLRVFSDADEIEFLEYGATWASKGVEDALANLRPGKSEQEIAEYLVNRGMQQSCHPMIQTGKNVDKGMVGPTGTKVQRGDGFIICFGLEGGLTCREGYVVESTEELPEKSRDYIENFVKPYYAAIASWYSTIGIGVTAGEIYDVVDSIIPKAEFGWKLNPGHLIAMDEWLSSPISKNSKIVFRSGMCVQADIIPSSPDYCGANVEDGICLADEALRKSIATQYPEMWKRMQERREYMIQELGIELKPEVLPLSNLNGVYCPLLLRTNYGLKIIK